MAQGRRVSANRAGRGSRSGLALFVQRYGWRAYAVPILSVITVVAVVQSTSATPAAHRTTAAVVVAAGSGTSAHAAGGPTSHAPATPLTVEGTGNAGFVAADDPAPVVVTLAADSTTCLRNSEPKLVVVSLSRQHLWACELHRQVIATAVTTGKSIDDDQTPTGSWRVQAKERDRYLVGPGYKDYVQYWVPFNGDFGLHDASWQTMPFGSPAYPTRGSHGCVHLPTAMMAWLYRWVSVGSTVVTVQA